jgi:hypothetical protein
VTQTRKQDRLTVINRALICGWKHEFATFDESRLIRDEFTCDRGILWVLWVKTPWRDDSRFGGAIFSDRIEKKDVNVWGISNRHGVLEVLGEYADQPVGQLTEE